MGCFPKKRAKKDATPSDKSPERKTGTGDGGGAAASSSAAAAPEDSDEDSSDEEDSSDDESKEEAGSSDHELHGAKLAILQEALGRLRHKETSRGWQAWSELHCELQLMRRGMSFLRNAQLGAGFVALRAAIDELVALQRAATFMVHRARLCAWRTWFDSAAAHKASLGTLGTAIGAFRGRARRAAWTTWRDKVRDDAPYLAGLAAAIQHMRLAERRKGWRAWVSHVSDMHALRGAATFMVHRARLAAWRSWAAFVHEMARMRQAVGRLRHRELAAGWQAWAAAATERQEFLAQLRNAVGAMRHRGLASAWRVWHVAGAAEVSAELGRAAGHLLHAEAARGFRAWTSVYAARTEALRLLRKGVGALTQRKLAAAWASWAEAANLLGTHKRRQQRRQRRRRALGFLHGRNLGKALNTWAEYSAQAARASARLNAALRKMANRPLTHAFNGWHEAAAEHKETMSAMRRGMLRMLHRELTQGFATWHLRYPPRKGRGGAVASTMASVFGTGPARWFGYEETPEEKLVRGLRRLMQQDLARGWSAWAELRAERAAQLGKIADGLRHMIHRELLQGFQAWRTASTFVRRLRKASAGLTSAGVARGWRSWLGVVAARRAASARLEDQGSRALRALMNRQAARGFGAWRAAHEHWAQLRRCARHLVGSSLARAWRSWSGMLAAREATLQTLRACVGTMRHRQVATAMASWKRGCSAEVAAAQNTAHLYARAAAYFMEHALDAPRAAWLRWQGRFAEKWKRRYWAEWTLAHPIEPLYAPRQPRAPPPGSAGLFDRVRPPRVANPHAPRLHPDAPLRRIQPHRQPRKPGDPIEDPKKKKKPAVTAVYSSAHYQRRMRAETATASGPMEVAQAADRPSEPRLAKGGQRRPSAAPLSSVSYPGLGR